MSPAPQPPYLVIRDDRAFWVEVRPPSDSAATLQAFRGGCFDGAWCYDSTGTLWPIQNATLKRSPSLLQRLLFWRQVAVALEIGTATRVDVPDVVARLARVLRPENEFCAHLPIPPTEAIRRFETARTPEDIIRIASGYDRPAA